MLIEDNLIYHNSNNMQYSIYCVLDYTEKNIYIITYNIY